MLNLPLFSNLSFLGNPISIPCLIFTILYFLVSAAECVAAFFEKEMLRRWIKPFCMITLFIAVLCFKAQTQLLFIYLAIIFAFLGDLFMMFKRRSKVYLMLGTVFFFDGHLCYLANFFYFYHRMVPMFLIFVVIGWVILFVAIHAKAFVKLSKHTLIGVGMAFYLSLFSALFICLLTGCIKGIPCLYLSLIGCVLFMSSDLFIVGDMFRKIFKKRPDFWIMITYLPGQFLLVLGFLLSYGLL